MFVKDHCVLNYCCDLLQFVLHILSQSEEVKLNPNIYCCFRGIGKASSFEYNKILIRQTLLFTHRLYIAGILLSAASNIKHQTSTQDHEVLTTICSV